VIVEQREAVVVGSGLAGMTAALGLGSLNTLVISKTESPFGGSTPWAQGGIAFPRDEHDAPVHVRDTLISGAGHAEAGAVEFMISRASAARQWLEGQGIAFDRDEAGNYQFGQEGAHSRRRILHVGADATGSGVAKVLANRLLSAPWVTFRPKTLALRLLPGALLTFEEGRGLVLVVSPRIVLAGGGLGQLFEATTAPVEGTGDTIALALEAGLSVSDLEMVQFHPTALAKRRPGAPSFSLLSEALRGEGATLVTTDGSKAATPKPLETGHPSGSLGPRDVLSRAIFYRQSQGCPVWLDARGVSDSARRFPNVTRLCAEVDLDLAHDLLPVVPAVHYTMGGVVTNHGGRTSYPGVWAVGETARTGVHGANRLASNSLLECVVFGLAAAGDLQTSDYLANTAEPERTEHLSSGWAASRQPQVSLASALRASLGPLMSRAAGPVRTADGLQKGLDRLAVYQGQWDKGCSGGLELSDLTFNQARTILEARNLLTLGSAVLTQALHRTQSLGAHFRGDDRARTQPENRA